MKHLCLFLIFVCAGFALAVNWTNDTGNQLWSDPGNWDTYPAANLSATIDLMGSDACIVPDSNSVVCNNLFVGNSAAGELKMMTDAVIQTSSAIYVGYNSAGELKMMTDAVIQASTAINVGYNSAGTLFMDGGTISSGTNQNSFFGFNGNADVTLQNGAVFNADRYVVGPQGTATCNLTINNSTLNAVYFLLGRGGDANVSITNGDIICTGGTHFKAGERVGNFIDWDQDGGSIQHNGSMFFPALSDGDFNISNAEIDCGGILAVCWGADSDATFTATNTVINTNRLVPGYLGRGEITLNNCDVTTTHPGVGFGVEIGYSGAYCSGKITMNGGTMDIANELRIGSGTDVPGTFEMNGGTVNCYQVKVSAAGDGTFLLNDGVVNTTSFVMQVGNTYMNIEDGMVIVNGDITDDLIDYVNNGWLEGFSSPRAVAYEYDTDEYPDKTIIYADQERLNYAWQPDPNNADQIAGEDNDVTLAWEPGIGALSHDVYFGTEPENMALIEDDIEATSTSVGVLELGETYYWQVVEFDGTDSWEGDVWSFSILPFLSVDDFEDYADEAALQAVWGASSGMIIEDLPGGEETNQRMAFAYGDTVTKTFAAEDWTDQNIEALHLIVSGLRGNAIAGLEVTISDGTNSATVTDSDTMRALKPWFTPLRIDLDDFTGVDLTKVTSISLTIGTAGGGTIIVDDIGIYVPAYIAEMGEDLGDLNYDAFIDNFDFAMMAGHYLTPAVTVNAEVPSTDGLLVYYDFEDPNGSTVTDLSGNDYDGFVRYDTEPRTNWTTSDTPFGNNAIHFNGGHATGVVPVEDMLSLNIQDDTAAYNTGALSSIDTEFTVAAWVKVDPDWPADFVNSTGHYFSTDNGGNKRPIDIFIPFAHNSGQPGNVMSAVGNTTWGNNDVLWGEASDYTLNGWNHYAFTKDTAAGKQSIYINGVEIARLMGADTGVENAIVRAELGGSATGRHWQMFGSVDEFRVYDRVLSQGEIVSLANEASVVQPALSDNTNETADPDLDGDGDCDLDDLKKMMTNWLVEPLWP